MRRLVELGLDRIAWPASSGSERTTTLNHEPLDDAMKCDAVVVADPCQANHIGTVSGRIVRKKVQQNATVIRFQFDLIIILIEVNIFDRGCDLRLAS